MRIARSQYPVAKPSSRRILREKVLKTGPRALKLSKPDPQSGSQKCNHALTIHHPWVKNHPDNLNRALKKSISLKFAITLPFMPSPLRDCHLSPVIAITSLDCHQAVLDPSRFLEKSRFLIDHGR